MGGVHHFRRPYPTWRRPGFKQCSPGSLLPRYFRILTLLISRVPPWVSADEFREDEFTPIMLYY